MNSFSVDMSQPIPEMTSESLLAGLTRARDELPRMHFARRTPEILTIIDCLIGLVGEGRCQPWPRGSLLPVSHIVPNVGEVNPWHCFMHDLEHAQERETAVLPPLLPSEGELPSGSTPRKSAPSVTGDGEDPFTADADQEPTAYVFGDQIRGNGPRLIHAVESMLTAHSYTPGYFSGLPASNPCRPTPFAGIAEIPATASGFGRLKFRVPENLGHFSSRPGLPNHAFHVSATVTPAGFATDAHLDYFGALSTLVHFQGAKIWITCPRTPHNARLFDRPGIILGNNLAIMNMLNNAEQIMCQIIDTPCSFTLDAFEYHAVICLSNSIHMGGPVYCAQSVPIIIRELHRMMENLHSCGISPADATTIVDENLAECLAEIKDLTIEYLDQAATEELMSLEERTKSPSNWRKGWEQGKKRKGRGASRRAPR